MREVFLYTAVRPREGEFFSTDSSRESSMALYRCAQPGAMWQESRRSASVDVCAGSSGASAHLSVEVSCTPKSTSPKLSRSCPSDGRVGASVLDRSPSVTRIRLLRLERICDQHSSASCCAKPPFSACSAKRGKSLRKVATNLMGVTSRAAVERSMSESTSRTARARAAPGSEASWGLTKRCRPRLNSGTDRMTWRDELR
mmetsp:Transcript_2616/g.8633  ORF Transcript_2616/g.8633 Transcript_2616/m.8633 type:complete len:200 (+) Transcript_2616:229-828(+)